MLRREFFLSSLAGTAALVKAQNPKLRLGYDTYSLRAWGMKAMEHLEFAAKHGCTAIQLSSLGDFESLEAAHLEKVKAKAAELNIVIDGGTGCICPTSKAYSARNGDAAEALAKALKVAKAVGARTLRCFLGSSEDRLHPNGIEYHMEQTVKVFRACKGVAEDTGVKIALENHSGDMQAWELKALIEEAGKSYVGACADTGNPIWCVEDPAVTLEVLGPLTVTTHVRDTAIFKHPRGCAAHWTALGAGSVDLVNLANIQKKLAPGACLHLELITGRPPRVIPYFEREFWKAFPKARAGEFARFLALVEKGSPLMGAMVIEDVGGVKPPEFVAALKRQQWMDLEAGLKFAQEKMI
ncbi:MAG: sugar phosphate isomerase/epimerase [Acidobacteria bacterium]|nr:sugar phosphate isomerase/epimerase [Acidobacteriota bacterium]